MTAAERMRKHRARKALRAAIERALRNGFTWWTVQEIVDEYHQDAAVRERLRAFWHREFRQGAVTPIGVTQPERR